MKHDIVYIDQCDFIIYSYHTKARKESAMSKINVSCKTNSKLLTLFRLNALRYYINLFQVNFQIFHESNLLSKEFDMAKYLYGSVVI